MLPRLKETPSLHEYYRLVNNTLSMVVLKMQHILLFAITTQLRIQFLGYDFEMAVSATGDH